MQVTPMGDDVTHTEAETPLQKEEIKPNEKMIKTKILGLVLLIFTLFWTFLGLYDFITFGLEITSFHIPLYLLSYVVGIALLMIKKRGIYHITLVFCGIILVAFYVFLLGLPIIFS